MEYNTVIGLEVHVQLKTKTKLFCSCKNEFGAEPNTNICPVCTGQPGVLPVLNEAAVRYAVKSAVALNCKVNRVSIFARKHYFYPDLPKNYQISQYESPLAENGYLEIESSNGIKKIGIRRLHLEEDAGKLIHKFDYSLIDFNRTGTPLIEIVTEPEISSAEEAHLFLKTLKLTLEYLGVSDCDMEKGSLRCDANISLSRGGELGTKTEIKNMNSFKSVVEALNYESKRQFEILSGGGSIINETRLWNEKQAVTESMRGKEEVHDYRYFPDPDLPPLVVDDSLLKEVMTEIGELPLQRKRRFKTEYGLSDYDAEVLTSEKKVADYFEEVVSFLGKSSAKSVSNWVTTELLGHLNKRNITIDKCKVNPKNLAELLKLIDSGKISGKIGKTVLEEMVETGKLAMEIVEEKGLSQITDERKISDLVDEVIRENQKAAKEYLSGKSKALGALMGALMRKSGGRVNPKLANEILRKRLKNGKDIID